MEQQTTQSPPNPQQPQQTQQAHQAQQPQQPQQPQQAQQAQQPQTAPEDGRSASRKRITKSPPDSASNKRPSGNSGSPSPSDQPPAPVPAIPDIPERSSSYTGHDAAEKKGNTRRRLRSGSTPDSGAVLTAAELLKMGGVDLQKAQKAQMAQAQKTREAQKGAEDLEHNAGGDDSGEDSEATEFGDGSETLNEQQQQEQAAQAQAQQPQPQQPPQEPSPTSFAARKGKGKDKKKSDKKNKDKGPATGSGAEGKASGAEGGGKQDGNRKHKERERDGSAGGGSGGDAGLDNGGEESLANYAFVPPHPTFIEEDMDSDDDGHGHEGHGHSDYHDQGGYDNYGGHGGHLHGMHGMHGGDDSNVINLNTFPTNTGPNGARLQSNLSGNTSSSLASSAFATITNTLVGMVPLPRASRDDYVRTMSNDRHGLQQTVNSLVTALQREQMRRMAAEENLAVLEDTVGGYKGLVEQLREEAAKLREEAERYKKGHMQVLRDLNRFKAGQGFAQMADDFLTQKARELRQDIRDFAIQYFDGEFEDPAKNAHPPARADAKLGEFMFGISPLDPFKSFLVSPTRCSAAVEAFLWVILAKTVFDGWYWAGAGRLLLHDVFTWMRPEDFSFAVYNDPATAGAAGDKDTGAADPEAERRFYTWRATTAKLVSERPRIMVRDNLRNKLVEEICVTIGPYLRSTDGSHTAELHNIINKAIEFDRDTSQQASRLEWIFCRTPGQKDPGEPVRFNPAVMDIQKWEEPPTDQSEVLLVVSPGLRKRGRSNGEDYAVETMLLKMDVTCDPVTDMIVP